MEQDIGNQLLSTQRKQNWAIGATLIFVLVFAISASVYAKIDRQNLNNEQNKTTSALCTYVNDLKEREARTEDYVKNHPHGGAGLTVAQLNSTLVGERHAIEALSGLDCSKQT